MWQFIRPKYKNPWILMLLAVFSVSWARPQSPTKISPAKEYKRQLDYVIVKINDVSHVVAADSEVVAIVGDTIIVESAKLKDKNAKIDVVNLVGFRHPVRGGSEDRGMAVDSAKQLDQKYSENGNGNVYAITANSRQEYHGATFIKLIQPTLKFAAIEINGVERILHDGEAVKIKKSDMVKVKKVETNVKDASSVKFQIFEQKTTVDPIFEIRFSRGGHVFARIPLTIEE